jgi:hypothetical protein
MNDVLLNDVLHYVTYIVLLGDNYLNLREAIKKPSW